VAQPVEAARFETIVTEKEMVRLGSGSGDMKELTPEAIDRGVACLTRFRKIAELSDAHIRAVATSAVREAENRDVFLRRVHDEAGIDVEVISGAEEARLIHLGVLQAVAVFDQRHFLIDIGGGSTEFLVAEHGHVIDARSVKLGAIRLTDHFFGAEPITADDAAACRTYVRAFLSPVLRDFRRHGFDVAVGSSGTVLNLAEMALVRRPDGRERRSGNLSFTRGELDGIVDELLAVGRAKDRAQLAGLDAGRADIVVAGALLLQQVMAELHIEELIASDYALREGLLLDTLQRAEFASLHHLADIRYDGVIHLASLVPDMREHGDHTAALAMQLFDATEFLHHLGEDERELLEAAALLANVGLVISHARHHLHAYYVIRNAEHLTGFTDREIELMAQVARYHRKSAPKSKHADFAALSADDQRIVRTLAGILRIAIALDRSYSQAVRSIRCKEVDGTLELHLETVGDTSLERYTAEERKGLLESVIDRQIIISPAEL
jgi:exopolyphosphatase/guanosine-5'-triphosphate,3'-diphosphate pyrophosphatase